MRACHRIVLLAVLVSITPVLVGCSDFDPDKFDFLGLNKKKPLPGKREDLFPNGVPGVTQGIPPQYMKGYQEKQQQEAAAAAAAAEAADKAAAEKKTAAAARAEKRKAKPKPKRKRIVRRKPKPKPPAAASAAAQPAAQKPAMPPWPQNPSPSNQAGWPNSHPQPSNQAGWPSSQPRQQAPSWPSGTTSQ